MGVDSPVSMEMEVSGGSLEVDVAPRSGSEAVPDLLWVGLLWVWLAT